VLEARTDLVLLLDDDCLPQRRWAASLVAAIEDGAVAAAGPVVNSTRSDIYGEATQIVLDSLTQSADRGNGVTAFVPTYNLACRRELLVDLPFEVRHTSAAADRDWCARLTASGAAGITIVPEAVVVHQQLLDLRRFWRKHYDYGRGSSYFHRRHSVGFQPPGFYLGLVGTGFNRGPLVGLAVCVAQLATGVGFAVELVARNRHRAPSGWHAGHQ
jgi:GT2 family glycosyltransferase